MPITWTFGYLEIIAALTGLIAATALLLYLAARQRQRVSAFHLGRRMGITDAFHLRSLLLEVAAVLVGAWLAGSTLGLLCVELAYRLLDLNPTFPPQPQFDLPVGLLGRSVLAVAVATVLIGALAHVAARRTEAGSVLRVD
ncbi:MAG: FtsX-like permease family protein [Geodermatophilaceae bacterium]